MNLLRTNALRRGTATGMAIALAACTSGSRLPGAVEGSLPPPPTTVAATVFTCPADQQEPAGITPASYEPGLPLPAADDLPAGSTMAAIRASGRLRVGVSADTLLFGSRDPQSGRIEGFDIDMLQEVAKAVFGVDDDQAYSMLDIVVIPYGQRIPALRDDRVDIVAHTMTINCVRWQQIAFSSEYYHSGQKLLVQRTDGQPQHASLEAFAAAEATVCVPAGSTNQEFIQGVQGIRFTPAADGVDNPDDEVVAPADISDCLVLLQQGKVDGITGDDTVLAGLAAQDNSTVVVPSGEGFTDEPYGLGFNADRIDFVQFVNSVLEEMRTDGRWAEIYDRWLGSTLGPQEPPVARYGRPVP